MNESIVLRNDPKIEVRLLDNGFQLIDGLTEQNTGFYAYQDLHSIELNNPWFPRLAQWLRVITWVLNGVPYFPDAASCKKANLILVYRKSKLGIWLTDSNMANKAKRLKGLLDQKMQHV